MKHIMRKRRFLTRKKEVFNKGYNTQIPRNNYFGSYPLVRRRRTMSKTTLCYGADKDNIDCMFLLKSKGKINAREAYETLENTKKGEQFIHIVDVPENPPEELYEEGDEWCLYEPRDILPYLIKRIGGVMELPMHTIEGIAKELAQNSTRFLHLPCKVGDICYVIPTIENGLKTIAKMKCLGFTIGEPHNVANLFSENRFNKEVPKMYQPGLDEFGKSIFLSEKEAEKVAEKNIIYIYKANVTQVKNGKIVSEATLVNDFTTIQSAKINARECLLYDESYYSIREYNLSKGNVFINGDCDNGVEVFCSKSK